MKEMVGGCCVCSDERGWPENPLVYCDGQNCTVAVHQACYGIVTVPSGPWYCRKCESQERSARVRCELCPSRDGALKKTDNQGWAHVVCALYIPEVRFGNVTTMEPIILQLIPQERYTKTCYICQEVGKPGRANVGACMQCNKSNCKQQFHVTCAQSLGLLCEEAGNYLDNVKYCGYCQHHYSKLKKGGNVKIIPPYKPITHDTSSDSGSSPEKEIDATGNATASSMSATSVKISTNPNVPSASGPAAAGKQRKSATVSKQTSSLAASTGLSTAGVSMGGSGGISLHGLNSSSGSGPGNISMGGTGGAATSASSINLSGSNSFGSAAGSSSTTNPKSSSSSSSSYKDKDKHSKSLSKVSSSSKDKDKDGSSSSSSSRESRDKSSKSKNKDFGSALPSSSINSTASMPATALSSINDHSNSSLPQNLSFSATTMGTASGNSTKDLSKSSSVGFGGDLHTSNMDVSNFGNSSLDATMGPTLVLPAGSNTSGAAGSVGKGSSNSNSSTSSSVAKKRKTDSKASSLSDEINNSFRDIIKDVSVTLTPLQQTDFEKEIEKSCKKQKTELSPPTHQALNAEVSTQNSISVIPTTASATTSVASTATTAATSSSCHKQSLQLDGKTAANLSGNISIAANPLAAHTHKGGGTTATHLKELHRDERYTAQVAGTGGSTAGVSQATTVSANNASTPAISAPSLYVSVPLSTANVPGINLPTTTTTGNSEHHATPSQSTRAASQQQMLPSAASSQGMAASSAPLGAIGVSSSGNGSLLERQSPRILHQAPVVSEHGNSFTNVAANNPALHGVIHQSGKSPLPCLMTAANLTATTTESGNLKISYEKQTTRVTQLQEQETAPVRRSRSRSGESGLPQSQQLQQQQQTLPQKSNSRSGKKRGAAATVVKTDLPLEKLSKISSPVTGSPTQSFRSEMATPTPPPMAPSPLSLPPPSTPTPTHTPTPTPTPSPSPIVMMHATTSLATMTVAASPTQQLKSTNNNHNSNNTNDIKASPTSTSAPTTATDTLASTNFGASPSPSIVATNISTSPLNSDHQSSNKLSSNNNNNSNCSSSDTAATPTPTNLVTMLPSSNKPLNKKLLRAQQTHYQQQLAAQQQQQQQQQHQQQQQQQQQLQLQHIANTLQHVASGQQSQQGSPDRKNGNRNTNKNNNNTNNNNNNNNNSIAANTASATQSSTNTSSSSSSTSTTTLVSTTSTNLSTPTNTVLQQQQQQQNIDKSEIDIVQLTNPNATLSTSASSTLTNLPQNNTTNNNNTATTSTTNNNNPPKTTSPLSTMATNMTPSTTSSSSSTVASSSSLTIHRTPDSGVFSSTSTSSFNMSNASTASSCSSTNNGSSGGLKFSYEAQAGVTNISTPPSMDTNLPAVTTIKDSPPSSPASEAGSIRKRGRKGRDSTLTPTTTASITIANDLKDIKVFQNGSNPSSSVVPTTTTAVTSAANAMPHAAAHMLGNQLNPNSNVAQKLSDQLHMEIQDHSIYTPETVTPQFVGVPFPGKLRNTAAGPATSGTPAPNAGGATSLATMFGTSVNGNLTIPQSLEQLLERQWEQGSQFLMEQAQHFDIASLLSCLHQLQSENIRLEEHVTSLIARRDHLLAVNARLAIPLNTNTTQSQATGSPGCAAISTTAASLATAATTSMSVATNSSRLAANAIGSATRLNAAAVQQQQQQHASSLATLENGIDFRQSGTTVPGAIASIATSAPTLPQQTVGLNPATAATVTPLSLRHSSSAHANYTSSITTAGLSSSTSHNPNSNNIHHNSVTAAAVAAAAAAAAATTATMPPIAAQTSRLTAQHQPQQQIQHHHHHMQLSASTAASTTAMQQHATHTSQSTLHQHSQQKQQLQQQQQQQQHAHLHSVHTHSVHPAHSHTHPHTHTHMHAAQQHEPQQQLQQHHPLTGVRVGGGGGNSTTGRGGSTLAIGSAGVIGDGGSVSVGNGVGSVGVGGNRGGGVTTADGTSAYHTLYAHHQSHLRRDDNLARPS